ncbi:MAG: T9SS type A sorting domain-containing protein [Candidatus Tenebribacter mawsonii]|nr:T9SS type A sorting domain-containing protein [Candidatus Tenebribacter mawsonii]
MEAWWNTQNPDDVYYIATFDWSVNGVNMPFATEVYGYYNDFGNGYVPFFGVIGAYNIFMYGDNDYQPALDMVPDAIESFNHMGVVSPIADVENNFWGYNNIEITDMFATPTGNPITISITDNSNPNVASAVLEDDVITIIIGSELGSTEITVTGDDGSDETVDDVFVVTALNPNLLSYEYDLEDSPTQGLYPNNPNQYANSYTDLGWTSIDVTETDEISNVHFSVMWESVDYASEGTFRATSPTGTDAELYAATGTDPVQLELDATGFNGEVMDGEWIIYMVDSYGDGGHQISDGTVTFMAGSDDIGMVAGLVSDATGAPITGAVVTVSNIATMVDEDGQFSFDILSGDYIFTCEAEGYEVATLDETVTTGNLTYLGFELTAITGTNDLPVLTTELQGNYPNPFNPVTNIAYSVKEAGKVTLEVYNIKGQLVKTLVNDNKETGQFTAIWNGSDNNNKSVSSGVYFYKMKSGNYTSTKKMILMK